MTEHNHRRQTKRRRYPEPKIVSTIFPREPGLSYHFGGPFRVVEEHSEYFVVEELQFVEPLSNVDVPRNGRAYGYANKAGRGPRYKFLELKDKKLCAKRVPTEFSQGNRGMAKAVRGAKKFINSRFRFHENAETRKLANLTEYDFA